MMIDEFWRRGDKIVGDHQRADILGKRMFCAPMKDSDMVTFAQAKALALAMFADFGYREWRGAELDKRVEAKRVVA